MGYQQTFTPGRDFSWAVAPYLEKLPRAYYEPPLSLEFPIAFENKAKWQWYNWIHHHAPDTYQVSFKRLGPSVTLTITCRLAEGRVLAQTLQSEIPRTEIDSLVDEALKEAKLPKGETENDPTS